MLDHYEINRANREKSKIKDDFETNKNQVLGAGVPNNIRRDIPALILPERPKEERVKKSKLKVFKDQFADIDRLDKQKDANNAILRENERIASEKKRYQDSHTFEGHEDQLSQFIIGVNATRHSNLIVPGNTSLEGRFGQRFTEIILPSVREQKKKDLISEIYQKNQNAKQIKQAVDKYKQDCSISMEEAMKKRSMKFENRDDYYDLSKFIEASDQGFTDADKNALIDRYLGKVEGEDVGVTGKDRQIAMDLMVKSLMAIDLSRINIDTDNDLVRNASALESITGRVAAFDRQLEKYGEEKYYGSINQNTAREVKNRVQELKLVAQYYILMRDVLTDRYYTDHQSDEISLLSPGNQGDLHRKLVDANLVRKKIFEDGAADVQLDIKGNLRNYLTHSVYLDDNEGRHTARSIKSNEIFSGLLSSFNELEGNRRTFGANSKRMTLVKEHIADVNRYLNSNCNGLNGGSKIALVRALKELSRCCNDYHEAYANKRFTIRHQNVLDIKEYADRCSDFVNTWKESAFEEVLRQNGNRSLGSVLQTSSVIAEYDKDEIDRAEIKRLKAVHDDFIGDTAAGLEFGDDVSVQSSVEAALVRCLKRSVSEDADYFNMAKYSILSNLYRVKNLAKYAASGLGLFMSGARTSDKARERYEYADSLIKVVEGIKYRNIKNRNVAELSWKELIFGEDFVDLRQGQAQGKTFSTDQKHERLYKTAKAIDFLGGDNSMFTDYKKARLHREDGTMGYGFCYSDSNNDNKLVSAAKLKATSEENGIGIVFSENALRQLTVIRIMDTLFGKETRSLDSIKYNYKRQIVYTETTYVIQSVVTDDFDYLMQPQQQQQGGKIKNSSILTPRGRINIKTYDRKVADEIISRSAEECLDKFKGLGLNITADQAEAFKVRFNTLKNALINDRDDDYGARYHLDQKDEKKRLENLKEARKELRKQLRWSNGDEVEAVDRAREKVIILEKKRVRNRNNMYTDDMNKVLSKHGDLGIIDESLLPKLHIVESAADIEHEVPVLVGTDKQKRISAARIKILRLRREKKNYHSKSVFLKVTNKKLFGVDVKNYLSYIQREVDKNHLQAENVEVLRTILTAYLEYANMDVSTANTGTAYQPKEIKGWFTSAKHTDEAMKLKAAYVLAKNRLDLIPANTQDATLQMERSILSNLKQRSEKIMNGKLNRIGRRVKFVDDESFHDVKVDPVTNRVTDNGKYGMIDRREEPLFAHDPCVSDISQGEVGDCYFLATIAAICDREPDFIRKMMKDNGDGTVTVRFYDEKNPVYVSVKKTVPINTNTKSPTFGIDKFSRGALWVQMLEKAYAASGLAEKVKELDSIVSDEADRDQLTVINALKRNNVVSYGSIAAGNSSALAEYLTGIKGEYIPGSKEKAIDPNTQKIVPVLSARQEEFWNLAKDTNRRGVALVAGSLKTYSPGEGTGLSDGDVVMKGVSINHSYTVMGVQEMAGEERIILRNPWGFGSTEEVYDEESGAITTQIGKFANGPYVFLTKNAFFSIFNDCNIIRTRRNNE